MKIYKVEFVEYTNAMRNHVYQEETDEYLETPLPFLIRESDIEEIKLWGKGIRDLIFVGYLKESDHAKK